MKPDIEGITLKVYRARLDADSGKGAADRQFSQDKDDGAKQQRRSLIYRPIVIETLVQIGLYTRPLPPQHVKETIEN
jgi:hypothetical protein